MRPRALVVLTGSELVRGDRDDRNGAFLARELTRLGLEPVRILLVGDDPVELERAIAEGVEADVCVLSGGLGPTHDDRTVETLARVAGRPLRVDEGLAAEIEAVSRGVAERLQRPYADFAHGVRKQASLPDGGVAVGLAGTAPAVVLALDGRVAVALPGPPNELRRLWPRVLESDAFRQVLARAEVPQHRVLRFFGPSESAVARALDEAGGEGEDVEVTVCAHDLEIRVDLYARGGRRGARGGTRSRARHPLRRRSLLRGRPTGGGARPGALPGSRMDARDRRVVHGRARRRAADGRPRLERRLPRRRCRVRKRDKEALVGVPRALLDEHGAVSAEVADAMADGVRSELGADVGVSVTGIAGPDGGTQEKPVGLVFLSVRTPTAATTERFVLPGDREAVRARATAWALHTLRRLLAQPGTHAHERSG